MLCVYIVLKKSAFFLLVLTSAPPGTFDLTIAKQQTHQTVHFLADSCKKRGKGTETAYFKNFGANFEMHTLAQQAKTFFAGRPAKRLYHFFQERIFF